MHIQTAALALAIALLATSSSFAQRLELALDEVQLTLDLVTLQPTIQVRLNKTSSQAFGVFTSENVQKRIDIYVDDKVVLSPVIQQPILSGMLIISGEDLETVEQARDLAVRLRSGEAQIAMALRK